MLQAQLMGKLTRPENQLEDLLTSDLFGSLSYVPVEIGLEPILRLATDEDGTRPFQTLKITTTPAYQFWPSLHEIGCKFCEPDVIIGFSTASMGTIVLLLEVKYASGKSTGTDESDPLPTDQLAREWDNLVELAKKTSAQAYLVYVTPDFGYPHADVDESMLEFRAKRPSKQAPRILWLPWRRVPETLESSTEPILKDLVSLLLKLNLTPFRGISIPDVHHNFWSFVESFAWKFQVSKTSRHFGYDKSSTSDQS